MVQTPIVLIHGFPLDSGMWEPQVASLTAKGHRVLVVDLPGFGAPPATAAWAKERCSVEGFADHVHDFMVREAGGRAVVGGFSMGGYVLLALLEKYPESVAAAMFFDTRAEADSPEARGVRMASIKGIESSGSVGELVEGMLPRLLSRHSSAGLKERLRGMMMRQGPQAVIGAQYAMAHRPDRTTLLSTLKLPVLLVVGADDVITPPSVAIGMHGHMPQAMLLQVANAGHMANLEAPGSVNGALETFLHTL